MLEMPIALRPTGIVSGTDAIAAKHADAALVLAGGAQTFTGCEVALCGVDGTVWADSVPLVTLEGWAASEGGALPAMVETLLDRLTSPRPPFAGVLLDRPRIMGIVNVTQNSFHDGGAFLDPVAAIAHGMRLATEGADIVDVGGESSRPDAVPVEEALELERVVPVIEALSAAGITVSVDTRRARVMAAAADAGAVVVNDVTALGSDPDAPKIVADRGLSVVLMHMQGTPGTMQDAPSYSDAPLEIYRWLEARVAACLDAGIGRGRICVDPGIGFGKTVEHNVQIIDRFALLHGLGCAVMAGVSRKNFIAALSPGAEKTEDRLPGSLAATLMAAGRGVHLHRVHDVRETRDALAVWNTAA
jgi:dihydropteroate synthase